VRPAALIAGALACFALAVGLALLAADISGWRGSLPTGDVHYRTAPGRQDLWRPAIRVPLGLAREALGVEDDVAFRQALRAVRLGQLDEPTVSDPKIALLRNEAQARLEEVLAGGGEPVRRSRAANLLGVLNVTRLAVEAQDPAALLESAVASFEEAIALDPTNDEAKYNLELAFQRGRAMQLEEATSGRNPTPGGRGASGAGAGAPGSGY
jgi:hypothetical protein